jgi:hypothetical protein
MKNLNFFNVLVYAFTSLFSKIFFIPLAIVLFVNATPLINNGAFFIYLSFTATTISLILFKEKITTLTALIDKLNEKKKFKTMLIFLFLYSFIFFFIPTSQETINYFADFSLFTKLISLTVLFVFAGWGSIAFTNFTDTEDKSVTFKELFSLNKNYLVNLVIVSVIITFLYEFIIPLGLAYYLIAYSTYFLNKEHNV